MNSKVFGLLMGVAAALVVGYGRSGAQPPQPAGDRGPVRVVVRADDMGSCHAANVACMKCYQEGIVRSVEVIVPGPWFNEAVKMFRENPRCDVGVHLTLTSEWELYKWGPLTKAPSLVDEQGHFYPTTSQKADFPPKTGFLECGWKIDEVEKELRAQIELAKKLIPQVSHLSDHMGASTATPELNALVQKLSQEYKLPVETRGAQYMNWPVDTKAGAEERETVLIRALEGLRPGTWILVEHPGLDTPEMRAMGFRGYWEVAMHRNGVTQAFTSRRVKETINNKGIKLVSYHDVWPVQP